MKLRLIKKQGAKKKSVVKPSLERQEVDTGGAKKRGKNEDGGRIPEIQWTM